MSQEASQSNLAANSLYRSTSGQNNLEPVFRLYHALASTCPFDALSGLGGKLIYAGQVSGEPSGFGRNLLYAANIAGAASLAVSSDSNALRQAMRDGVIDFIVNSLEEALRILKNEIRKHQPVSVGISADPDLLTIQMLDRGVLPDLLPPAAWGDSEIWDRSQSEKFLSQGSIEIGHSGEWRNRGAPDFVNWSVSSEPTDSTNPVIQIAQHSARWLPRLDACVLSLLPADDTFRRRWIRLAPRYLGRLAHHVRGVALSAEEKLRFAAEAEQLIRDHNKASGEKLKFMISG